MSEFVDNPKQIIEKAVIFSKELNIEVVPKDVALYALELSKLDKALNVLGDSMKELNNLTKEL